MAIGANDHWGKWTLWQMAIVANRDNGEMAIGANRHNGEIDINGEMAIVANRQKWGNG